MKTKWIVADFAKGREVYAHIERELSGIPVGILGKCCNYDYYPKIGATKGTADP